MGVLTPGTGRLIDRVGALAGLAAAVLIVIVVSLSEPPGEPDDPAAVLARELARNRHASRVGAYLALLAAFLLVVFVARLHGALREASGPSSWFPTVAVIGGMLLVSILLVEAGFGFAASELRTYGQDTEVAKLFVLWSWNSANLLAPPFSAMLAGSTIVAFSTSAFPTWFRWAGVLFLAVMLILVAALRAPGLAAAPGTLWLVLASLVLASSAWREPLASGNRA